MKAREMPEKIYLFDYNDAMVTPLEGDTIYVREDAFIERACEYLDLHCNDVKTEDNGIVGWIDNEFINHFRQAMKDE